MIEEHLQQLRLRLEQASGLPDGVRTELLDLLREVRKDAGVADESEAGAASGQADERAGEQGGINRLLSAVDELEASHPEVASAINQVANTLAKMGI